HGLLKLLRLLPTVRTTAARPTATETDGGTEDAAEMATVGSSRPDFAEPQFLQGATDPPVHPGRYQATAELLPINLLELCAHRTPTCPSSISAPPKSTSRDQFPRYARQIKAHDPIFYPCYYTKDQRPPCG